MPHSDPACVYSAVILEGIFENVLELEARIGAILKKLLPLKILF